MFWNPCYFELRESAQPHFDRLADAHIFHDTPESAAQHVHQIWDDVAGWWRQADVQEARRAFCERYARMPDRPLWTLKEALLTTPIGAAVEEAVS
jgi:putative transferase (TIGR04331 family)